MPDLLTLSRGILPFFAVSCRAIATCLKFRRSPPPISEQIFDALGHDLGIFGTTLFVDWLAANGLWPIQAGHILHHWGAEQRAVPLLRTPPP